MPVNAFKGAYYFKTELVKRKKKKSIGILNYSYSKSMCGMTTSQEEDLVMRLGGERLLMNIRTAAGMT